MKYIGEDQRPRAGRFKLSGSFAATLTLCCLAFASNVALLAQELVNVAPSGQATQSPSHALFTADKAINGEFGDFSSTGGAVDGVIAYWQLDLRRSRDIQSIVLHNRGDGCCQSRLRDIRIFVLDDPTTLANALPDASINQLDPAGEARLLEVLEAGGLSYASPLLNPENAEGGGTTAGPASIEIDLSADNIAGRVVVVTRVPDPDLSGSGGAGNFAEADALSLGEVEVWTSGLAGEISSIPGRLQIVFQDPSDEVLVDGIDSVSTEWANVRAGAAWDVEDGETGELLTEGLADGEEWEDAAGRHLLVRFREIAGWDPPAPVLVSVLPGITRTLTASYSPRPRFTLGDVEAPIPPQDIRHGERLSFTVLAPNDGVVNLDIGEPEPLGEVSFDESSGFFNYEPHAEDVRDFDVVFRSGGVSQSVRISPRSRLAPEVRTIAPLGSRPDRAKDSLSVHVDRVDASGSTEWFNRFPQSESACSQDSAHGKLRAITVYGVDVVLESGNDLYESLHFAGGAARTNDDVTELSIYADTVIIRDPLRLAGTDVTIHARELRFEDEGSLSTKPRGISCDLPASQLTSKPWEEPSFRGFAGAAGRPAGNVALYVSRIVTPDSEPRILLQGGDGQDGGSGQNGTTVSGSDLKTAIPSPAWNAWRQEVFFDIPRAGPESFVAYAWWLDASDPSVPFGSVDNVANPAITGSRLERIWRELRNGDAVPAGRPGDSGAGGMLTSTIDQAEFVAELCSGLPGTAESYRAGSGTVEYSGFWTVYDSADSYQVHLDDADREALWPTWIRSHPDYSDETVLTDRIIDDAGRVIGLRHAEVRFVPFPAPSDAPAPEASFGDPGTFVSLQAMEPETAAFEWLHPLLLAPLIEHARDLFRRGRSDEARELLEDYYAILDHLVGDAGGIRLPEGLRERQVDLEEAFLETGTLLDAIRSGLDYWGNPPGWVPLLSFEVLSEVYEDEVDAAIDILYLTYWLGNVQSGLEAKRVALEDAQTQANERLELVIAALGEANEELSGDGGLEERYGEVSRRLYGEDGASGDGVGGLEGLLKSIEDRLAERARDVPWYKKAARTAAGILKVFPHPKAQIGGTLLDGLTRVDEAGEGDVFDKLLGSATEAIDIYDHSNDCDKRDLEKEGAPIVSDELCEKLEPVKAGLSAIANVKAAWSRRAASDPETQAQLAKLKASDPAYAEVVSDIEIVLADKQQLADDIARTLQKIEDAWTEIQDIDLLLARTGQVLEQVRESEDPELGIALRKMERRAKDRLLRYQYLVEKSFGYRFLQPSPTSFEGLESMLDKMLELAKGQGLLTVDESDDPVDGSYGQRLSEAMGGVDSDDFEAIGAIYTESLRDLTAQIVANFDEGGGESSSCVELVLQGSQLEQLNTTGELRLNLGRLSGILSNFDNVRLRRVHTIAGLDGGGLCFDDDDPGVEVRGNLEPGLSSANLFLTFRHDGVSDLRDRHGERFRFRHARDDSASQYAWVTTFNGLQGRVQSESMPAAATGSLLRSLLDGAGDLLLFSRPGADATITITKRGIAVSADGTERDLDLEITRLRLLLEYDYSDERSGDYLELKVSANDGFAPDIIVDKFDRNERKDGRGSFTRSFDSETSVTLEAPASYAYGTQTFSHWEISGVGETEQRIVDVSMSQSDVSARAVYRKSDGGGGDVFVRGDVNGSGDINLTDGINILNWSFQGSAEPACLDAADVDDSGLINLTDPIRIFQYLFLGGDVPAEPSPTSATYSAADCGSDVTPDDLSCDNSGPVCGV